MARISRLSLFLCLLMALWLSRPAQEAHAQSGNAGEALRLVNQLRAEHGLPPYQYNATLSIAAQNHANWMADNVAYSHTGAGGSSPQDRANAVGYNGFVSENIVGGMHMTPQEALNWWRNSAIHYRMMVSNRYFEAGVGFATNGTQNMYVLLMGRPNTSTSPAPPAPPPEEPQSEPIMVTPIELAEPREDGSIVHVVQEGQALWQIAAHYGAELQDLLLYNNLSEDDFIQPGDEIIVRLADEATPPPTPTPPLSHIVQKGENAWIITKRYGIELDTFFQLNGLTEDSILYPGNEVRIRLAEGETPPPTPTPKLTHVVKRGDTAWSIAGRYNLTPEELYGMNGITADSILQVGQELFIRPTPTPEATPTPASTPTPTPTPTPASAVTPLATPEPEETAALAMSAQVADAPPDAKVTEVPADAEVANAPADGPIDTRAPTVTTTPTSAATRETSAADDEGGSFLYIMSLFLGGIGVLIFIGVVLRRG